MSKIIASALAMFFAMVPLANSQQLPSGSVGSVTNNTVNTWQTYTYTFTPTTTGANFIGFAFRQDPAFWTFDNVRLTAAGSSTNLLTNGAFNTGGAFSVTTNNGPSSMQAPTNWGVWYQNGTYPAAAGTWTDIGGSHGGVWYDGAVGSFDGIYQGVALTAGTTYTISFEVTGNNVADSGPVQLGVYGGACATVSIAPSQCTIPANVGFTTLATPAQGASAGTPTPPPVTLVSTTTATPTSVVTTTLGSTTTVNRVVDQSTNNRIRFTVSRTTTPIISQAFTRTTVTTPHTIETYSDGSTVTTNGTPTTSSTTGSNVTVGNPSTQTATAASNTVRDAMAINRFNMFTVDPFFTTNGVWATPTMAYAKIGGNYRSGGLAAGYQKTNDNNTFGFGLSYNSSAAHDYIGSSNDNNSTTGTVYALTKQNKVWVKGAAGFNYSAYETSTSIPQFALYNSNKFKQNSYYADLTVYTPGTFVGIRPLAGAMIVRSNIYSISEYGSALLSTVPTTGTTTETRPYVGFRYDYTDNVGLETRLTHSNDFKTVAQVRGSVKKELYKNVFIEAAAGIDRGSDYTGVAGTLGIKVKF